jgi:hypothetical protein
MNHAKIEPKLIQYHRLIYQLWQVRVFSPKFSRAVSQTPSARYVIWPYMINIVTSPLLEKEGNEWESIHFNQLDNDAKDSDSGQDNGNKEQAEPEDQALESDDDGSRTIHADNDSDSSELSFLDSEDEHQESVSGVGQVQLLGAVDTNFRTTRFGNNTRSIHDSEENGSISYSSSDDESGSDYVQPTPKKAAKKLDRKDAMMKEVERSRNALLINDPDFNQTFNKLRFPYFPERVEVGAPIPNNSTNIEQKTGQKTVACEEKPFEGALRREKKYYDAS